jgi:hypothetical protein
MSQLRSVQITGAGASEQARLAELQAQAPILGATHGATQGASSAGHGPMVSPGLAHHASTSKGTGVPPAAASLREVSLGARVGSLKARLLDKLESKSSPGFAAAMRELRNYAAALKIGYPGEGETEGASEFRKYLLQKDGFEWDILRLKEPGKAAPDGGANINLYSAPDGTKIGAIEQGFASEKLSRADADKFFSGVFADLKGRGVELVIVEMNHPGRMDEAQKKEDDGRTPYRVDNALHMANFGVRAANANYGQITLNSGDDPVLHLALGILPTDPKATSISKDQYLSVVKGYFSTFQIVREAAAKAGVSPGEIVERDPTYKALVSSLAGKETIELLDPRTDWKLDAHDASRWQAPA